MGADGGAGVLAVCIGTEIVAGVGTGIGFVLGVQFSSSAAIIAVVFDGVLRRSLVGRVLCMVSVLALAASSSNNVLSILAFDEVVDKMGENGLRIIGDSGSQAVVVTAPMDNCLFKGPPPA